jgi:hypothetical protein
MLPATVEGNISEDYKIKGSGGVSHRKPTGTVGNHDN